LKQLFTARFRNKQTRSSTQKFSGFSWIFNVYCSTVFICAGTFNFKMVLLLCEDLRNHAIHKFFRKFARAKTLDGRKAITPQQVGFWGMLK
jgi:hypothetical protein